MGQSVCTDFIKIQKDLRKIRDLPLNKTVWWHRKKRCKITQDELSARSGISVDTISDIENGIVKNPRLDTIVLLAVGLRLPAGYVNDYIGKTLY